MIVDESLTSGGTYWDQSAGCPRFSHLTLTGGAIGFGPPAAVGAAVACPTRRVINIQADGSGLYAPQALWQGAKTLSPRFTSLTPGCFSISHTSTIIYIRWCSCHNFF